MCEKGMELENTEHIKFNSTQKRRQRDVLSLEPQNNSRLSPDNYNDGLSVSWLPHCLAQEGKQQLQDPE